MRIFRLRLSTLIEAPKGCKWALFKLYFSVWCWNKRGLKTCHKHGFYAQSWINGKCKKCKKAVQNG